VKCTKFTKIAGTYIRSVTRLKYIHTIKLKIKIKNGEIKYNVHVINQYISKTTFYQQHSIILTRTDICSFLRYLFLLYPYIICAVLTRFIKVVDDDDDDDDDES